MIEIVVSAGIVTPTLTSPDRDDVTALMGRRLVLDCSASGQPPPTITWFKDGQPLDPEIDDRLVLFPNGTLSLSPVTKADSGKYMCTATNPGGSVRHLTNVIIFSMLKGIIKFLLAYSKVATALLCCSVHKPETQPDGLTDTLHKSIQSLVV